MGEDVYCGACLGDPRQHWGDEIYLFRQASFGYGWPKSTRTLLDQIGKRNEFALYGEEDRRITNTDHS